MSARFRSAPMQIAGVGVYLIAVYGFYLLGDRRGIEPGLPVEGIVRFEDVSVEHPDEIEFHLMRREIGEAVRIRLARRSGLPVERRVRIVGYYQRFSFPILFLAVGTLGFGIGLFVLRSRPSDRQARIFFWLATGFAAATIISGPFHCLTSDPLSYIPAILFCIAYPLCPALLLRFSVDFMDRSLPGQNIWIFSISGIFALAFLLFFTTAAAFGSIGAYRIYRIFVRAFRFYLILAGPAAGLILIAARRRARSDERRAQIQWILFGMITGLGPFLAFYQLPRSLNLPPPLPEPVSVLFLVLIPICVAIAIVRYRLMEIDIIINRSLVYSLLTVFTVSLYLILSHFLYEVVSAIAPVGRGVFSIFGALVAAGLFQPARVRFQDLVDRTFFRVSYDYRKVLASFQEKAQRAPDRDTLITGFETSLQAVVPVERIRVETVPLDESVAALSFDRPLARRRAVRSDTGLELTRDDVLDGLEAELLVPMPLSSSSRMGFVFLGRRKSGERFSRDDIELIRSMTGELALNLEKLALQEEVILERAERARLDELNRIKTEFVDTVSHELRTPMSTLRSIAEVLQNGRLEPDRGSSLLALMSRECRRLSNYLGNILDSGRIERGDRVYCRRPVDIADLVSESAELARSRIEREGGMLSLDRPEGSVDLAIDAEAVRRALANLIDNAIKYSKEAPLLDIRLVEKSGRVEIAVSDRGIGIEPFEQERIFEKFQRGESVRENHPRGVGLGLSIVRHVMRGHGGEIQVRSRPGEGSTFTMIFPRGKHEGNRGSSG